MRVSIVILAAGSSSRMGSSKQLLPWGNETLLHHSVKTARDSIADNVYVVLGSNESEHRTAIEDLDIVVVDNKFWENGMGSSLKAGLTSARDNSDAVMFMVCDQPFVSTGHLNLLITKFREGNYQVVASRYQDVLGVPAIFAKEVFEDLLNIPDNEGARRVIDKHREQLTFIELQSGQDLDTPADYKRYAQN